MAKKRNVEFLNLIWGLAYPGVPLGLRAELYRPGWCLLARSRAWFGAGLPSLGWEGAVKHPQIPAVSISHKSRARNKPKFPAQHLQTSPQLVGRLSRGVFGGFGEEKGGIPTVLSLEFLFVLLFIFVFFWNLGWERSTAAAWNQPNGAEFEVSITQGFFIVVVVIIISSSSSITIIIITTKY